MIQTHRPSVFILILIGVAGGLLSGLFGIGGGIIIVPALISLAKLPHRLAAGTSVAAILPAAIVGASTYALHGDVDWIAGALLALGIIFGAQVGSKLLVSLPLTLIRVLFLVFILGTIVSLWIFVPVREQVLEVGLWSGLALVVTGVLTGMLSGVLGVGGGIIVVPVLMLFFGANDLVAKGTSLLMMIPGSVSGTVGNAKRHNVDIRAASIIGISACVCAPLGALVAARLEPQTANIVFSIFLMFIFAEMLVKLVRSSK